MARNLDAILVKAGHAATLDGVEPDTTAPQPAPEPAGEPSVETGHPGRRADRPAPAPAPAPVAEVAGNDPADEHAVGDLDLAPQVIEALIAGNVATVGDVLTALAEGTLTEVSGIGDGRKAAIIEAVEGAGFTAR